MNAGGPLRFKIPLTLLRSGFERLGCAAESPNSLARLFLFRPDKARTIAVVRHGAGTVGADLPGLRIDAQEAVAGQRHQRQFARRRFDPLKVLRRAGLAGRKRQGFVLPAAAVVSPTVMEQLRGEA